MCCVSVWYGATPYIFRRYYYDYETGFYYLNSRYYDPSTGRFINADGYVSTGQGILGNNMYAYCANNLIKGENKMRPIKTYKEFVITFSLSQLLFFVFDLFLLIVLPNAIRAASVLLVGSTAFVVGYPIEYKKLTQRGVINHDTKCFLKGYAFTLIFGI